MEAPEGHPDCLKNVQKGGKKQTMSIKVLFIPHLTCRETYKGVTPQTQLLPSALHLVPLNKSVQPSAARGDHQVTL